jgi:hypothetical protein
MINSESGDIQYDEDDKSWTKYIAVKVTMEVASQWMVHWWGGCATEKKLCSIIDSLVRC